MSIRSYICIEKEEGKYLGVYCHSDGYPTYNGAMLLDHYSSRERVEKLIELGDISLLEENLSPDPHYLHDFDHRQEHVTLFYSRDRGDKKELTEARYVRLEKLNIPDSWIDFVYVYGLDNIWRMFQCGQNSKPKLERVSKVLETIYKEAGIERPDGYYGTLDENVIAEMKKS